MQDGARPAQDGYLFCLRLDMSVDGPHNSVYEIDVVPAPAGDANPHNNSFVATSTLLEDEHAAQRLVDPSRSRTWRISNASIGRPRSARAHA